jgi:Na+/H+-translocating membrane pyrophosphatase
MKNGKKDLDPQQCIKIATNASLREMILPGIIVIFTPLILGGFFGPKAVAGYLVGVITSGVQMAIASSNTGGAWDNAKKYIESGKLENDERIYIAEGENDNQQREKIYYAKGSKPYKASVIGDTVGDPLKDTSGPSINILIKLSAIVSLVFGGFFSESYVFKGKLRYQRAQIHL